MSRGGEGSAALADMPPAYFALVMATGIVSIASETLGLHAIAVALLALDLVFYPLLWALTILRVVRYRERVIADLRQHGRCVGFFTTVAATSVLGSQLLVVGGRRDVALVLWIAAIALWAVLTYGIFTILTIKPDKPTLAEGINGGWLVAVVASHSVAVLGAQLAPGPAALLFCLAMWLGGSMLYLWIISLIFHRYMFFPLSAGELAPPYWVNMGAAAIATLAGSTLVSAAPSSPVLTQALPFIRGLTLFWWATATWWIPLLLVLGVWRHVYEAFPLRYDPSYWSAVFPLGMYTACTVRLSRAIDAPFLMGIPRVSIFIALAAWALALQGMVRRIVGTLTRPETKPSSPDLHPGDGGHQR